MLSEISIRNVVLIEALDLELASGFTAMTGETGAGKSIILDALGMAIGARSDRSLVRKGTQKAQCIATFTLPKAHIVWRILGDADLDGADDGLLVLRRTITEDGRSRAYINDQAVSVKLLLRIGKEVLEVHGQHDGRGLLDPASHRVMLDEFGDHRDLLLACKTAFETRQSTQEKYDDLMRRQANSDDDRDYLQHAIAELDRLAVQAGEDVLLADERRLLQHAEGALSELSIAGQALGSDGAHEAQIAQALAGLDRLKAKIGGSAEEPQASGPSGQSATQSLHKAGAALEKVLIELEEARAAVAQAAHEFEFEPGRLDVVEERFFALRAAARKYDVDVEGLVAVRQKFGDDLLALEHFDQDLEAAKAKRDAAEAMYRKEAQALSKARTGAATQLDSRVGVELPALKMASALFQTQIEPGTDSAHGCDQISFCVRTNPDTPVGPLHKIASGGELARLSLAIKVAQFSGDARKKRRVQGDNKVMIFDEVDQGVGGAVADAVGKRLASLSKNGQVFVVTHSPQVAAGADHQYLIQKSASKDKTITDICLLEGDTREEEIARMLAGETITDAARAAARQLMQAS
jgi:DNA repair protein RecN (Recombination protein N)